VKNTLGYYNAEFITAVKSFYSVFLIKRLIVIFQVDALKITDPDPDWFKRFFNRTSLTSHQCRKTTVL